MIVLTHKGLNKLADKDGFIIVYPDGIELNWNDGRMDEEANDRAHRENIDDIGFISALIDTMIKDYNINPKQVTLQEFQMGAIMSYRLACELSHKNNCNCSCGRKYSGHALFSMLANQACFSIGH